LYRRFGIDLQGVAIPGEGALRWSGMVRRG
jgi:hypothetical protein